MIKGGLANIKKPVTLVVLLYVLFGSAWILFSDKLLLAMIENAESLTWIQTFKGWFYVMASGGLIYFLMAMLVEDIRNKEKTLHDTELLHENFLNKHYQPIWKSDSMGNCIFSNLKWKGLTGEKLAPNKPFIWLDRVHPHDKPATTDAFTYGFINKNTFEAEYRMLMRNNQYQWVKSTCIPYHNARGQFTGFYGFYSDIQEIKIMQENYRDSSKKYGYLFANNPNPMLVYDQDDLRILEANKAAIALYGYSEQDFLAMTLLDLRPQTEVAALMEHVSEVLPEFHRSSGWIHKKKDGTLFDAEVSAHLLPVNNHRRMRLVLIRDITGQKKAFRTAKEGERRFKAIFENSPQGALICSEDLQILDINPSACKIFEISSNEAIHANLRKFIPYEFDPVAMDYLQKITGTVPVAGELNMNRSSGVEFRARFNSIRFIESGVFKIYIAFNDIDQQHKMQIALQQSERINATLVSNLPGMVYRSLYDEAWTMTYVSFGVEKLTGYKPSELLFNSVISYEEIIHPLDRQYVRDETHKMKKHQKSFDLQYRITTREGKVKWVWEQAQIIKNDSGETLYIEGFIIDITHEREIQQEVEFQSMFLGLIIDNIPFPLYYTDVEGRYMGCNKGFCEYIGLEKSEIVGRTVFEIFELQQAHLFFENDRELLENGGSTHYETEIKFPNGRKMDAVVHKTVFNNLNQVPFGVIGIFFDITERVKAEKVIKKQIDELGRINSELEKFSYTVSHDLRSPLVTIKGFLGLLKEDLEEKNEEQIKEDIIRISNATDKMQQLLEDLLKLSRIDKKVELNHPFSMTQAAREAQELLYGLIIKRPCSINIDPDMPVVMAGKSRVRELYQNLLENAIKFSADKMKPVINVYARKDNDENVYCVQDNGIGIPEKYHQKIFSLFTKLDNNSPGTGIGLSLVKQIVDHYKGRIWVESTGDNSGTTFCFTLNTEKLDDEI